MSSHLPSRSIWSKIRRFVLCRNGVHYDASQGLVRKGQAYWCCYDCMALELYSTPSTPARNIVIVRRDNTLSLANLR